ncbi:PPE domain-containing protein [Nocardia amamiensis]|uniref:PPE domain-containing protein n=1 Tax=Nocardia amamiensis TaxID=404578 RepID=UPI0033FAC5A2
MTYEEYRDRIIAAQEQWNRDRANIYTLTNIGNDQFDGDYEPPKITNEELALFETAPLEDLVQRVAAMNPGTVLQAAEAWFKIGTAFRDTTESFNTSVQRTIAGGWSGQAAGKASEAVRKYSDGAGQLTHAAHLLHLKLTEMYTGLHQTQALMPGITQVPDLKGKTLPQDGVMKTGDYTTEEARAEAQRILQTVYWQVANQTDNGVPVIPAAPNVISNSPGPAPSGSGVPGATDSDNGAGPGTGDKGSESQNGQPDPGTQPAGTTPESVTPAATTTPQATAPTTPGTPQSTPSTTATPVSNAPGVTSPGSPGSPTGRTPTSRTPTGRPTGIPGSPTSTGAPGRSIPGAQQQPAAAPAAAARSGAPSSGRPGMAGMPGMAPGAAQRKDDEQTSGVKDYLITKAHGEEVTGLDSMPRTVPPVIGSNPDE